MNDTQGYHRNHRRRTGLTLAEVVVSTVSAMTLMAGLSSAVFIASRAVSPSSSVNNSMTAGLALDEIATELRHIKKLVSRSSQAIEFQVDDRSNDLDANDETIRYAWSGTPGSPFTRSYNGISTTLIADVYECSINCVTITDPDPKRILFIQGNVSGTEATYDNTRVSLIQGWGYTVVRKTTIASTEQTELEAAAACADLVYVSTSVTADDLNTKLKNTPKPVIIEELNVADSFGMTSANASAATEEKVRITDNTHYITSPFAVASTEVFSSDQSIPYLLPTLAPGLKTYCKDKGSLGPDLAFIERGGVLVDNSLAAGLRIAVFWGGTGMDPNSLKSAGRTLWQRTLDWAARKKVLAGTEVTLRVSSSTGPVFYTYAEAIGRPRP